MLGSIREVQDFYLIVSLPSGLLGQVRYADISDALKENVEELQKKKKKKTNKKKTREKKKTCEKRDAREEEEDMRKEEEDVRGEEEEADSTRRRRPKQRTGSAKGPSLCLQKQPNEYVCRHECKKIQEDTVIDDT